MALIVPGFSSTSDSAYVRGVVNHLSAHAVACVVVNHRGVGTPLRSEKVFTVGDHEDVRVAMVRLRQLYGSEVRVVGIAFSMGGNILLNYVAAHDDMVGAMSICQGYDGLAAVRHIESQQPFFRRVLLAKQKQYVREHRHILRQRLDVDHVLAATDLFELERRFTCALRPESGRSPEQYFDGASCLHRMHRIERHFPLLLLNAMDDPLVPTRLAELTVALSSAHPNIIAAHTSHGGHLGFMMSDSVWRPTARSFADEVALEFIHAVLLLQSRRAHTETKS